MFLAAVGFVGCQRDCHLASRRQRGCLCFVEAVAAGLGCRRTVHRLHSPCSTYSALQRARRSAAVAVVAECCFRKVHLPFVVELAYCWCLRTVHRRSKTAEFARRRRDRRFAEVAKSESKNRRVHRSVAVAKFGSVSARHQTDHQSAEVVSSVAAAQISRHQYSAMAVATRQTSLQQQEVATNSSFLAVRH